MQKLFIDSDICLDLLAERMPHYESAARLFTLADKGKLKLHVSSLIFSNLHYLLSTQFSQTEARRILNKFKVLVNVVAADEKIIELALSSDFKDFEDAIQYFAAIENNINILLTRNLRNYRQARISVMTAEDFLSTL
jgi:predicted nucleic acid-binding protein